MYSILRLCIVVTGFFVALLARSLLKRRFLISMRLFVFSHWLNITLDSPNDVEHSLSLSSKY